MNSTAGLTNLLKSMLSSLPSDDPATKDDPCWAKNLGTDSPKPFFDCGGRGCRIISVNIHFR